MLLVNPHPPTGGRDKAGEGRETYKLNIKIFTNNTNNTNKMNKKRNNVKHVKPILSFPELGVGALASCQQLPGSTGKSRTGLRSRWELDSGMHGLEYGSGL